MKLPDFKPGQARAIIDRLRRGPATSAELAALSLKYTGRISDARAKGYDIRCDQGEPATYTLVAEPSAEKPAPPVDASGQLGFAVIARSA